MSNHWDDTVITKFLYKTLYLNIIHHCHVIHAELRNCRIPTSITKRIGFWKAEEFRKFCYPASGYILGGILPDHEYHVWVHIVRIPEMVFNAGRCGWTKDDIDLLHNLITKHNILTEEVEGITSCVITLHSLIHMPEKIERFSSPDTY